MKDENFGCLETPLNDDELNQLSKIQGWDFSNREKKINLEI